MIDNFYKAVIEVLNKNQMGKISPSEFNSHAYTALKAVQTEVFADFRKLSTRKARMQDTPNYGNESFNLKQAIEFWVEEDDFVVNDQGKVLLGDSIYLINSIFTDEAECAKTDLIQFNRLNKSGRMKPSKCSPIYTYHDGMIKISPLPDDDTGDIASRVNIAYYRKAKAPKWTYKIVGGKEMFNPDATDYQDLDVHPMLLHRLFVEVLSLSGINLRDEYITQAVAQMKQVEFNNEQG